MDYLKHYVMLMRKAQHRQPPSGYTEKHHIFPKSIWGKNDKLVILTGREHYIAHALLERAFIKRYGKSDVKTKKMCYAFYHMGACGKYGTSYLYEGARERRGRYISEGQMGANNPIHNRVWDEEARQKMSEAGKMGGAPKGRIPWNKGKPRSQEVKDKIAKAHRERWANVKSGMV